MTWQGREQIHPAFARSRVLDGKLWPFRPGRSDGVPEGATVRLTGLTARRDQPMKASFRETWAARIASGPVRMASMTAVGAFLLAFGSGFSPTGIPSGMSSLPAVASVSAPAEPAQETAPRAPLTARERMEERVRLACDRNNVPVKWMNALIFAESTWRHHRSDGRVLVSDWGAVGLTQVKPSTAQAVGIDDVYDVDKNVEAGVREMARLRRRFNNDMEKVLAAYNAGENAVLRYGGIPPYKETRDYVRKITALVASVEKQDLAPQTRSL